MFTPASKLEQKVSNALGIILKANQTLEYHVERFDTPFKILISCLGIRRKGVNFVGPWLFVNDQSNLTLGKALKIIYILYAFIVYEDIVNDILRYLGKK